jgi:tRNA A37 methylthiotransferase MiaB
MHKKKISFVNPNFQQGPKEFNAYYLPYSPGIIWSYVSQFDNIADNFELDEFIWRRDPIEEVVERLKDNDIVGFSTYIWNRSYNHVLGRELKKANPKIFLFAGGPEPPITDKEFFKRFPYLDLCVKQEGEKAVKAVLEQYLTDKDYLSITGLIVNNNGSTIDTGLPNRINDLDTIPSPYLTDVFKPLIDKYPEVRWNATLETNRGCPYMCTFCDWGSLTYSKVKKFELARVYLELEWIGKNECDFVSLTDANFGIFPERDSLIADKLIAVQKEYDNPKAYTIAWAKNQKQEVVEIVRKLIFEGGSKMGLNLSVQSMDDNVLDIIKRKNLAMNKIQEVFDLCEKYSIPLYTELILGLPGESLETWKDNFYKLFKAGNHTGITVYQAQLLENAEMNLTQKAEYELEGRIVYDYLVGTYNEHEVKEGIEVIVSTKDMPREQMIEAQVWSWFINTFHINGITSYISRFLYKHNDIEYKDFYEKLFEYISHDEWFNKEIKRIAEHYTNWTMDGKIDHEPIQGMEIHGWNLIHSTVINLHAENKHGHVIDLLERFLNESYDLPKDLVDQLVTLQRLFLIDYNDIANYPKVVTLDHDIIGYVQDSADVNDSATYEFDFPEDKVMSLQRFCEQIFFARRRNFGKAWVTKL